MAVATLSPWPNAGTQALTAATACLKAAIGPDLSDERVQALGATASALVERYAPSAPDPVRFEATIRCAGWLAEQPAAAIRSDKIGDIETSFTPTHTSALRHSGAMALLSWWKVWRAGAI